MPEFAKVSRHSNRGRGSVSRRGGRDGGARLLR